MNLISEIESFVEKYKRPDFIVDIDQVGLRNYVFGGRIIHSCEPEISTISHEMAHLIQLSGHELRWKFHAWDGNLRFKTPSKLIFNTVVCEPETTQISMREIEVFYIQSLIEGATDLRKWVFDNDIQSILYWLPDNWLFFIDQIDTSDDGKNEYVYEKMSAFADKWNYTNVVEKWFKLRLK